MKMKTAWEVFDLPSGEAELYIYELAAYDDAVEAIAESHPDWIVVDRWCFDLGEILRLAPPKGDDDPDTS